MNDHRSTLIVDMDGVMVDVMPLFLARLNTQMGTAHTIQDVTSFHHSECFSPVEAAFLRQCWKNPFLYDNVLPEPGVLEALRELRGIFNRVVACSAPIIGHVDSKMRCLRDTLGFSLNDIVVVHDKSLIRGTVMIDDRLENLRRFPGGRICFKRPWNQSVEQSSSVDICSDDWEEIVTAASILKNRYADPQGP